jgi:hypothetical protein
LIGRTLLTKSGQNENRFVLESSTGTGTKVQPMNANETSWLLRELNQPRGKLPAGTDMFSLKVRRTKTDTPDDHSADDHSADDHSIDLYSADDHSANDQFASWNSPVTTQVWRVPGDQKIYMREFPSIARAAGQSECFGSKAKFLRVLDGPTLHTTQTRDEKRNMVWSHLCK